MIRIISEDVYKIYAILQLYIRCKHAFSEEWKRGNTVINHCKPFICNVDMLQNLTTRDIYLKQ